MSVVAPWLMLALSGAGTNNAPAARRLTLQPFPTHVYKAKDRSHEKTVSWIFSLAVQSNTPVELQPESMAIDLMSGRHVLRHSTYSHDGFAALTYKTALTPKMPDGTAPASPLYWPLSIRLRYLEPVALPVDSMHVTVTVKDARGKRYTVRQDVPVGEYTQKTHLVFPFRGKGIIL